MPCARALATRFGRLQPSYFSKELIGAIASLGKVCKYIDILLQDLNSSVLQWMARPGGTGTVLRQREVRGGRAALRAHHALYDQAQM